MSTFDGKVVEFPDIRIDFFRVSQKDAHKPLAFFLSHIHSDHLAGLESCKSPFIYCSPATREILLRLEKYPHRMNFAKGILESRKQTYRHLKNLLKPIPLDTPTTLELAPGRIVRVTLFDANHCTGATTFLIEDNHHAILYTGDIRSELWWVNNLARHPLIIPYTGMRKLDCIYLDTTFACDVPRYKSFPSKCEGIAELLRAVSLYPDDTVFYFNSWTLGYEDVWTALSAFLGSRIHVDDYRFRLYSGLSQAAMKPEDSSRLIGFHCGNHFQEGCLTRTQTRLHSCEPGTSCVVFGQDFVRIIPIISRWHGEDMLELGAGGGHGDLDQQHELELSDWATVQQLLGLCRDKIEQPAILEAIETLLSTMSSTTLSLDGNMLTKEPSQAEDVEDFYDLPLEDLMPAIVKFVQDKQDRKKPQHMRHREVLRPDGLPKRIMFPYSRHSSVDELCSVIELLKPEEIHPCTVPPDWSMKDSMTVLFGHLYPEEKTFRHDDKMRQHMLKRKLAPSPPPRPRSPILGSPVTHAANLKETLTALESDPAPLPPVDDLVNNEDGIPKPSEVHGTLVPARAQDLTHATPSIRMSSSKDGRQTPLADTSPQPMPSKSQVRMALRGEALAAALRDGDLEWAELNLISTRSCVAEDEL